MALANEHITAAAVAAAEYPDLVRQYQVTGVPKTVINETGEILGAVPEAAFVSQMIAALGAGSETPRPGETNDGPA